MLGKIKNNKKNLIKLCRKFDIKAMYVFGSATTDDFQANSDIDMLISFKKALSVEQYTNNYFELHHKIEALLERKVDLITEESVSNPYFKEAVEETKEPVYVA